MSDVFKWWRLSYHSDCTADGFGGVFADSSSEAASIPATISTSFAVLDFQAPGAYFPFVLDQQFHVETNSFGPDVIELEYNYSAALETRATLNDPFTVVATSGASTTYYMQKGFDHVLNRYTRGHTIGSNFYFGYISRLNSVSEATDTTSVHTGWDFSPDFNVDADAAGGFTGLVNTPEVVSNLPSTDLVSETSITTQIIGVALFRKLNQGLFADPIYAVFELDTPFTPTAATTFSRSRITNIVTLTVRRG